MSQANILNFFIAGTFGILLHLFAVKLPSLKEKARVGNLPFSFGEYLKDDWIALSANFLTLGILIFCWDEIVGFNAAVANYAKWLFVFVGFTGSSIVLAALSVTNKRIMSVIDYKTNVYDGKIPPLTPENEKGVKEQIEKDKEAPVVSMDNQTPSA